MTRVAICGPHGIGKTTLARKLAKELNMWYVPEVARELLDMAQDKNWKTFNADEVTEFEKAVLYAHMFYVKQANYLSIDFVSDRSVFDIFAYVNWHKRYRKLHLEINLQDVDISSYLTLIDKIIFFKFRESDSPDISQQQFQQELEKLLSSNLVSNIVTEIDRRTKFEDIVQIVKST